MEGRKSSESARLRVQKSEKLSRDAVAEVVRRLRREVSPSRMRRREVTLGEDSP